jgi:hypothetical protein
MKKLLILIASVCLLCACNASNPVGSSKTGTAVSLPTYSAGQAVDTPTPRPTAIIGDSSMAATQAASLLMPGVTVRFTSPYSESCQIYQVNGKNLLTTASECYIVLPANNVLWGRIIGATLLGPIQASDDFNLPAGVMPVKKITASADGFSLTPESTWGMTQVGVIKIKIKGEIWPLMIKIQVGQRQKTAGPAPTRPG